VNSGSNSSGAMTAGIAIGVAVPIVLLVAVAVVATLLLWRYYSVKPPQEAMELHQMVNEVYTNSIYMTDADHVRLHRHTWVSA